MIKHHFATLFLFWKGVGFVQLFTSCIMFLSYPTIASYSFAYVSQAIVSGDDNLRNGTAYNFCYNTHEIRYCDLKDDKFIFKLPVLSTISVHKKTKLFLGFVVAPLNPAQMNRLILKILQWDYLQEKTAFSLKQLANICKVE